jgi:hypothetical protein
VQRAKRWYTIDPKTLNVTITDQPKPGDKLINQLPQPSSIPVIDGHGRRYNMRTGMFAAKVLEKGLTALVTMTVGNTKPKRSKRR